MISRERRSPILVLCFLLSCAGVTAPVAADPIDRPDLERIFTEHAVTGTFAFLDVSEDRLEVVNPDRARQRFFPASTFKIANSLIALEVGVVADENEVIPYGGKPQPIKSWEKDMSMREAITVSNVPVYVELAHRIGIERYGVWLERLGYGNQQTGQVVKPFWLVGPLKISALEQVDFLSRLANTDLPANIDTQAIVGDIIRMEEGDGATLYAKSGWSTAPDPQIAWWVGWIERDGKVFVFALNIDVNSRKEADLREPLTKTFLEQMGVWKKL